MFTYSFPLQGITVYSVSTKKLKQIQRALTNESYSDRLTIIACIVDKYNDNLTTFILVSSFSRCIILMSLYFMYFRNVVFLTFFL